MIHGPNNGKRGLRDEIGLMMLILLSTSCSGISGVKACEPENRFASVEGHVALADGTSTVGGSVGIDEVRDPGCNSLRINVG